MAQIERDRALVIIYDGECPFCRNYVELMALREAVGKVELIDAREMSAPVVELIEQGFDLNEGMVAKFGGKIYYGSDAVLLISTLTQARGWAARAIAALLRDQRRAALLYPLMKRGRRIVLWALRKPLIRVQS